MATDRRAHAPRSRAHRGLLFEYVLGISLIVLGLTGMTVMQTRLLLLGQASTANPALGFWQGEQSYDGDDSRSLSDSLRVCGDGNGRPVELGCWRDQMAALLQPRQSAHAAALERHRIVVGGVEREVIVFGGLPDKESGAGITIADAASGTVIWHARKSIRPGYDDRDGSYGHPLLAEAIGDEIAAVDADQDGLLDRLYFGDSGGRLWRADLAGIPDNTPRSREYVVGDQPALWRVTPIFSAVEAVSAQADASSNGRRFANRPDVVQASDPHGRYDAVLIGTVGDSPAVENWFYLVKDRGVVSGMPVAGGSLRHAQLRDLSDRCDAAEICVGGRAGLEHGWRVRLAAIGERFDGRAITAAGSVLYTTWTPSGSGCDGRRMLYAVSMRDARPAFHIDSTSENDPVAREILDVVERSTRTHDCHVASNAG